VNTRFHPHEDGYRTEIIRKAIHFSSIVIPIFYFFTPREAALEVFVPLTIIALVVDIARHYFEPLELLFNRTFGKILRHHESNRDRKRLNGATWVLISATLAVIIFPKLIAITAFLVLIISDLTAALIGKRFGRHRFLSKTREGSLAFFLSAVVIVAVVPKIDYLFGEYLIGICAAAITAVVEALPIDVDDNFSVPMSFGGMMWLGYWTLFPMLDMYRFG
jgi:dolichol kinase